MRYVDYTNCCVYTVDPPDDEHCDARNMYRGVINKDIKKCVKLVISKEFRLLLCQVKS